MLAGAVAPKPDDEPIVGCRDTIPEPAQITFDIVIAIERRPPLCSLRAIIGCYWPAAEIVGPTQNVVVSAGILYRPFQRAAGGGAGCDVERPHAGSLRRSLRRARSATGHS